MQTDDFRHTANPDYVALSLLDKRISPDQVNRVVLGSVERELLWQTEEPGTIRWPPYTQLAPPPVPHGVRFALTLRPVTGRVLREGDLDGHFEGVR